MFMILAVLVAVGAAIAGLGGQVHAFGVHPTRRTRGRRRVIWPALEASIRSCGDFVDGSDRARYDLIRLLTPTFRFSRTGTPREADDRLLCLP